MVTDAIMADDVNMTSPFPSMQYPLPKGDPTLPILRDICDVYLTMPIAIFGIIGNILAFIVLCKQRQKLTTTILLQALAVVDTLVLILAILARSLRHVEWDTYDGVYHIIFLALYPWIFICRLADTWLTVLLTIDRFIVVCYPLHAQSLCTLKRSYISIAILLVASVLVCIPRFLEYEYSTTNHYHLTSLAFNPGYVFGYQVAFFFCVMYLIPMVFLIVLNIKLVYTLRRAHSYREMAATPTTLKDITSPALDLSHKISRSITIIVVSVVLICIICNSVAMTVHILYSINKVYHGELNVELPRRYLANVSNLMLTINSAINFVIYCLCSRRFRSDFFSIILCRHRSSMQDQSSRKTYTESMSGSPAMRLSVRNPGRINMKCKQQESIETIF